MDYKTRIKVAAIVGLIVVVVLFVFMIVFVKGNSGKGKPVKKNVGSSSQKQDNNGTAVTLERNI